MWLRASIYDNFWGKALIALPQGPFKVSSGI